ncbi:MAG: hypothetical protein KH295_10065 [Clostridiaceae bacterium]|nr:hypothetical protein [Clostridiaceae bacterium]
MAGIEASGYSQAPDLPAGKTAAPAYGTEGYAALKMLLVDGIEDTSPAALFYYDETGQPVTILSPVFLVTSEGSEATGDVVRVLIDIGGLSVDDLREVFHTMRRSNPAWQGNSPYLTIYGKQYENGYIEANRVVSCIDQTTWTAQQTVPEEENWRVYFQQRTQSDALLDAWMDAREYLTVSSELLASGGVDYSVLDRYRTADFVVVPSQVYGIAIEATHTYDRSAAVWDDIDGMVLVIFVAFLTCILIIYYYVRKLVVVPLYATTRQAQHVAHLEFDQFHPDTARGDEIGQLNRALSDMAGDLHARWDSERDLEDKRQQFVAAASHDLKTPLALIGGYAEAIAQDISPEENARYLAAIEQETGRMNELVREMLDYTRLDRTDELQNRKTVDLTALTRSLLEEYAPLFENRRLTSDIADGVRIRGDGTLLRRAFGCLLENAAKYSPDGGRISVTLRQAQNALLTVENDCEPIPEEELSRLFEMFYRGDKARSRAGGHGLGLTITRRILALHHLSCRAESTKTGVRFTVSAQ